MEGRAVCGLSVRGRQVCVGFCTESERWFWVADLDGQRELLREIGREAADLSSNFTWHQAALLTEVVRRDWPKLDDGPPPGSKLRNWILWLLGARREP